MKTPMLVVAVASLASATAADTIHVDDDNCPGPGNGTEGDPYCSIQTAIDNAEDTDEIVVAPGTYLETIDFLGKAVTLRSSDGPEVTTIDANGWGTGVTCDSGEGPDTVLHGFTVTRGKGSSGPDGVHGGGMYNSNSSPTIRDCRFKWNRCFQGGGGGMFNSSSSPMVTGCTFSGNDVFDGYEHTGGGGMANWYNSNPTVTGCTFSGNVAGEGGGMANWYDSNPTVTGCTFSWNFGGWAGGGMGNVLSSPMVIGCTFTNCSGESGGGMINGDNSSPTVRDCTFCGNGALTGGGMLNFHDSNPTVVDCTFSGNHAGFGGGAIANEISSVTMVNCTFSRNSAGSGGGGMTGGGTVINCIFWGDSPNETDGSCAMSYCDVDGGDPGPGNIAVDPQFVDGPSGTWTGDSVCDVQSGQTTFTDANASFVPDKLVGQILDPDTASGSVRQRLIVTNTETTITAWGSAGSVESGASYEVYDYRLSPDSPCIDAGDNTAVPDGILRDLAGNPRIVVGSRPAYLGAAPVVDMGAYEFQIDPADRLLRLLGGLGR